MAYLSVDSSYVHGDILEQSRSRRDDARAALKDIAAGKDSSFDGYVGWYGFPKEHGYKVLQQVAEYKNELALYYDAVLVVGVGGSYLGAKAVYSYYTGNEYPRKFGTDAVPKKIKPLLFAGYHLSEYETSHLLKRLDELRPLVVVVSKSGGTLEPTLAARIIENYMTARFGLEEADRRTVFVTDPEKGKLTEKAQLRGNKTFPIPPDVGGRYSVFTACGLVPLYLAGIDANRLLEGAEAFYNEMGECLNGEAQHPALEYATIRAAAAQSGKKIENLFFNEPRFKYLMEWWRQLFAESEGKSGKGMFPCGFFLTADLHSTAQMLQEGNRMFFSTFLEMKPHATTDNSLSEVISMPKNHGFQNDELGYLEGVTLGDIVDNAMKATRIAHFDVDTSSIVLEVPGDNLYALGYLMSFFKVSCAVSCVLQGVHPFTQPGVEAYKTNLMGLLGKPGAEPSLPKVESS